MKYYQILQEKDSGGAEGRISLGKLSTSAGLENKWEMIRLLNERGVDLNYTSRDAGDDLETLNRILA